MDITAFTALLSGVKRSGGGNQYTARCPAHEDSHNSLSVGRGDDGRILLRCHAGCETSAVLAAMGLKAADLFPAPASAHMHTAQGNTTQKNTTKRNKTKPPPSSIIQEERGAIPRSLSGEEDAENSPGGGAESPSSAPVAARMAAAPRQPAGGRARGETNMQICKTREVVYPYTTADGAPLFETVRIQYSDGSKTFRQRHTGPDGALVYNLSGVSPVLYRLPALQEELSTGRGEVYLCEGEKDADLLAGLGLCATTAPMGAGKWREEYTESLLRAKMVTLLPDNDKPGRAHAVQVAASLAAAGVPCQVCDLVALYGGAPGEARLPSPALPRKGDVADVLEASGGEAFRAGLPAACMEPEAFAALAAARDLEDEAPSYKFGSAADYMQDAFWREIKRVGAQRGLSTGFAALDAQLDGSLYPGLYVIGSVSSLGKTAFCLQMADALAAAGHDVLFFTLEMSRLEMVGRSIVRQAFINSGFASKYSVGHLLHGKLPEEDLAAAARDYHAGAAAHIAFIEGGFDLGVEAVARRAVLHYAATGRRPVIFVDYLQILRPPDMRMSDKQATDHNVVELKRLSRQLEAPVIAVSSFNRQNYSEEVNMASFKESGAIEYSADFVLGLQARGVSAASEMLTDEKKAARMVKGETKSAKKQDPRPLEAVTLKNRRGPAWARFELDFYPRQNYFAEVGGGTKWGWMDGD